MITAAPKDRFWGVLSFFGLLALGAVNGIMGRGLKKRESAGNERTLKGVARSAWIMCALTAVIAVLMEVKPWGLTQRPPTTTWSSLAPAMRAS